MTFKILSKILFLMNLSIPIKFLSEHLYLKKVSWKSFKEKKKEHTHTKKKGNEQL